MQISNQPITWQQQREDDLKLKPNIRMREKSDLNDFLHKYKFYREWSEKQKQTKNLSYEWQFSVKKKYLDEVRGERPDCFKVIERQQ